MQGVLERLNRGLRGRYEVLEEAGRGATALVFRARDLRHDRNVAIKVLLPDLAAALGVERFLSEIRITAGLQHPGFMPLFDSGEVEGLVFYVMPFAEGASLRERLDREGPLPVSDAVHIAERIASALAYAHERGVIHRDLKPANVMLVGADPMVADLGVARALTTAGGEALTRTGVSVGTPLYMSPEQASGEGALDARSDVYSLGCVLFEMLAGEPPFSGSTTQAILTRKLTGPAPDVSQFRDTVPPRLADLIRSSMARAPADRLATAEAFRTALEGALVNAGPGEHVPAREDSKRTETGRPWLWTAAIAAVLFVAAFGWFRPTSRPPTRSAPLALPLQRGQQLFGTSGRVAISEDGSTVAYVVTDSTGPGLFLYSLLSGERRRVETTGTPLGPFFSPDGEWVGFLSNGYLRKARVSGGPAVRVTPAVPPLLGATWAEDGRIIYSDAWQSGLKVVSANGGTSQVLLPLDSTYREQFHSAPHMLPGGNGLVFGNRDDRARRVWVWSLDLQTLEKTRLVEGNRPQYVEQGFLLVSNSQVGPLAAYPFDPDEMRITGDPIPLPLTIDDGAAFSSFRVSRAGDLLYTQVPAAASRQLYLVDRDGEGEPITTEEKIFMSVRFSPTGDRLAVGLGGSHLWVYDLATGSGARIGAGSAPVWTEDGDTILYTRGRAGLPNAVRAVAATGGDEEVRFETPDWAQASSFAPDGKLIYGAIQPGLLGDVMSWDGGAEHRVLVSNPGPDLGGSVSPGGRFLAYSAGSPATVYVTPYPDGGRTWVLSSEGGTLAGSRPAWSPEGTELYYTDSGMLWAASITTDPDFGVLDREPLFPLRVAQFQQHFDLHPDGKRFAIVRSRLPPGSQVVIVFDWIDNLVADGTL